MSVGDVNCLSEVDWPAAKFLGSYQVTHTYPWMGEKIFLLREEGGEPNPAHTVHKSSTDAPFSPDLALILTWGPASGLVYTLALFPAHSANLAVCFHCLCCASHPCLSLGFWELPLTPFMGSCPYQCTSWHSSSCCCEPLLAKAKCLS